MIDWLAAPASEPGVIGAHRAFRAWRTGCRDLGPSSSLRAMSDVAAAPLARLLGFSVSSTLADAPIQLDLISTNVRVPCVVCPWADVLDRRWRDAVLAARRLGSRWALIFNGTHLRLLDALRAPSRRWLEFDLDLTADTPECFGVLWRTLRVEMFVPATASAAPPLDLLIARADARAVGVCRSLRDGVLSASGDVLTAMLVRHRPDDVLSAFEQSLTVVYRMLFLLFAESRGLVPMWHPVYKAGYSIDALRSAAERGRALGIWDALRAVCRLAHDGCRAGDLNVTPFNGRLFDVSRAPLVERGDLDDEAASRAVLSLTTRVSKGRGRERIAYRDLGVEQLGAVYETLLDYEPQSRPIAGRRSPSGPHPQFAVSLERGSSARKTTGSFYTPQPIAQYLVRQTIRPLVTGRTANEILSLKVLDPSMGSGAFLVAACRFLAESYEEALIDSGSCLAGDVGPAERAAFHRLVAERCLFGVDLNPMAVQLARLSLWLATLARDRPLSFLDHHIRTGDSLLGAWLSSLADPVGRRPRRESTTRALFDEDEIRSVTRHLMPIRFALAGPDDTIDQVKAKERALAGLELFDSMLTKWKLVADLWCAHWLGVPSRAQARAYRALADFVLTGRSTLPEHIVHRQLDQRGQLSATHRLFHWSSNSPRRSSTVRGSGGPTPGSMP